MKQILVLMIDFGCSHRSSANAIAAALHEIHSQDCVLDFMAWAAAKEPMNENPLE